MLDRLLERTPCVWLLVLLAAWMLTTDKLWAEPWFTGPILAPAGHTIDRGHTNVEIYGFDTINRGFYSKDWKVVHTPYTLNLIGNVLFSHGLTDRVDVQYALPYVYDYVSRTQVTDQNVGDVSAQIGFQVFEQKTSRWKPDLRVTLQETFPTGKFLSLDPLSNGSDATGLGAYQTALSLNFAHMLALRDHYLRTRFSLSYVHASSIDVDGVSAFGGTDDTEGVVHLGDLFILDLATEFTLNQNWVAVMEAYYATRGPITFTGEVGNLPSGVPGSIGQGDMATISLAPAIEYNFSSNVGLIAGPWFSVAGRQSSYFISYVVALNVYW